MKKRFIIANWKMKTSPIQAARITREYCEATNEMKRVVSILCPSFSGLSAVRNELLSRRRNDVLIGAQNCFWEMQGSYTGEESPEMLASLGCKAVILGHSERKIHLGENDTMIAKKVYTVLSSHRRIIPIICVGETHGERKMGKTNIVIKKQLESIFKKSRTIEKQCILTYEPLWSINPGRPCTAIECRNAIRLIRSELHKLVVPESFARITLIYGGSVTSKNAADLIQFGEIDGFLIGQASLNARELARIHEIASAAL